MPHSTARILPVALGALLLVLSGCSQNAAHIEPSVAQQAQDAPRKHAAPGKGAPIAPPKASKPEPAADPLAYMRTVATATRELTQYTVTFTRTERRGLLSAMHGPERIACWYRRTPLSVRMKWLDKDVKYGESTYVEGQNDSKVRFIPRNGFLGLKPTVTSVDVQTPVAWGEARYPMTDFGVERLMARTLATIESVGGNVRITYEGESTDVPGGRPSHRIRLTYPPAHKPAPLQDLYFDAATNLPVRTVITHADGKLESEYSYADLDAAVALSDADFLLDTERAAAGGGSEAGAAANAGGP